MLPRPKSFSRVPQLLSRECLWQFRQENRRDEQDTMHVVTLGTSFQGLRNGRKTSDNFYCNTLIYKLKVAPITIQLLL